MEIEDFKLKGRKYGGGVLLITWLACLLPVSALAERCAICNADLIGQIFVVTDKVTNNKKHICPDCEKLPDTCFVCGLPIYEGVVKLTDGRNLCARDAKTAVLDSDEAMKVYEEVSDALERLLIRFTSFPSTNVHTTVVDRINLMALFKVPGNDYACPNVLGYYQTKTNQGKIEHDISLMGALPRAEFKAVCAHELTHAWECEHISAARKKTLSKDSIEGFCELMAYMLMDAQQEEDQMKAIRRNAYTRGQIDAFIEAESRFGINEIIDWMQYGVDATLHRNDLNNVRRIEVPNSRPRPASYTPNYSARPAPTFDTLALKAIIWGKTHPMAVINNRTFEQGQELSVQLGSSNVLVRCVSIRENVVRIKIAGSEEELRLPER